MALRAYIITASDSGYAGEREDLSGPAAEELLRQAGYDIAGYALLPDDRAMLAETMRKVCDDDRADLLVTTGGTGFSPRDCTPEATADVIERATPGIPEAMRYYSLQITARAMLSRASAGIRRGTLIVNLPGSPKAVQENLEYILPSLEHGVRIAAGLDGECARK